MKCILIFLLFGLSAFAFASDKELIDTVDNLRNEIKPENNKFQKQIDEVYDAIKEMKPVEVNLPNYTLFGESQVKIMKDFGLPTPNDILPADKEGSCIDPELLGDFRIFIFISESVPMKTLKNYMKDVLKLRDALLVMRGVVGSVTFLKPTQNFISNIACGKNLDELKPENNCNVGRVDINPLLFSLFNIGEVPAIVFSRLSYQELMIRANMGTPVGDDEYFVLNGDTSLVYALERFEKVGAETVKYKEILQGAYGG